MPKKDDAMSREASKPRLDKGSLQSDWTLVEAHERIEQWNGKE